MVRNDWQKLKRFFLLFRKMWISYFTTTAVVAGRNLWITYFTAWITSSVVMIAVQGDTSAFSHQILLFLGFLIIMILVDSIGIYAQTAVIHRIVIGIRSQMFEKAIHTSLSELEGVGQRGELISRMNQDTESASSLLRYGLVTPVMYLISGIGATAVILSMSIELCLVLYIAGIAALWLQNRLAYRQRQQRKRMQEESAKIFSLYTQVLPRSGGIKSSGLRSYIESIFRKRSRHFEEIGKKQGTVSGTAGGVNAVVTMVGVFGVVFYGIAVRMAVDDIVMLSQMAPLICTMFTSLATTTTSIHNALAGMERIYDILDLEQEDMSGTSFIVTETENLVEANKITCTFVNGVVAFQDKNLIIPAVSPVAITGRSGGGKSTFVRLLLKIYPYQKGSLQLAGQEISVCSARSIRTQIAYVPQENIIFPGTIRRNLLLGNSRREVSEQELMNVLQWVGADAWVRQYGLDTVLPERGTNLSGGQRQMLAIARAILYERPIMILDEAFAGIDADHIPIIMERLGRLPYHPYILLITHNEQVREACREVVIMG